MKLFINNLGLIMVKFNKKNQIKYGVLALLFSFLTFGIFKNVEASPQGSSAQIMLNPVEIREQNNGNQTSFLFRAWSGIRSGIGNILTAPVRFFRWLFGGRAATPVVVEESSSGEEEDEEEEYKEEEEKIEKMNNDNESGNNEVSVRTKEEIINLEDNSEEKYQNVNNIVNEDDLPKNSTIADLGTEEVFSDFLKDAGKFSVFRADEMKENEEESEMEKGQDKTINNIKNDVSSLSGSPEKNLVPEKENDKIEEEDKEEEEKTEKGRSNTNDINPLPEPVDQPTILEIEEEEEDKTEIPTVPTTVNSQIFDTPSTSVSTAIHDVQGIIENKNEEDEIIIEEEEQVD